MIIFKGFKLDDTIEFDKEVDVSWNCADVKNVFCCNFMGYVPSVKNSRSDVYELYTLTDMWADNLTIDISNSTIASNGLTVVEDFMDAITKRLIKTDKYSEFLDRYDEIRCYLCFRFMNNWKSNLSNLFKISDRYDRTRSSNVICSNILERMIISVPERFASINLDEIIELPFIVGDYFYVIYTINYLDVKMRYKINMNLV
jgi:hypothetical protein